MPSTSPVSGGMTSWPIFDPNNYVDLDTVGMSAIKQAMFAGVVGEPSA